MQQRATTPEQELGLSFRSKKKEKDEEMGYGLNGSNRENRGVVGFCIKQGKSFELTN